MKTIAEIVNEYRVYEPKTKKGMLACDQSIRTNPEDLAFLKEHKQEILDYLREEEKAIYERIEKAAAEKAKFEASIGLDKLRDAIRKCEEQKEAYDRAFEQGDGIYPEYPDYKKIEELKKLYPVASAYLTAESWSYSSHHIKAMAGRKAVEEIRTGKDHTKAIADMKASFREYCMEHAMD